MKQFTALGALEAIQRYGVTGTTMVPTHFSRLLDVPNEVRTACDVSSLTLLDHTGSSCPVAVKEAMINWMGPILVDRYGGTEAGTVCTISSLEWLQYKGSAGKCLARFTAHVVDDNDMEVPIGQVGRLYFIDHSGEGVVYLNAPEKTAAAHIRPGVFTLGDLGYVNEEGYVFVTGRTADTVVSGGVNLYPAEIERVLLDCPGVREAAVVGVPDTEMGESLLACIVRDDEELTEADIISFGKEVLAGPKVPRKFVFVEDLPRNPVGKLDRKVLREMHANK
jgi:long-chain acyl-CoA synthetase